MFCQGPEAESDAEQASGVCTSNQVCLFSSCVKVLAQNLFWAYDEYFTYLYIVLLKSVECQ